MSEAENKHLTRFTALPGAHWAANQKMTGRLLVVTSLPKV